MHETSLPPLTPKTVLGVVAHPDDLDYYAGGTVAAFAKQGTEVYCLVLTDGAKGSSDRGMTPEHLRDLRRNEQRESAAILGVKNTFFCNFPDGELENTSEVKREIVKIIRQIKPEVVVTFDPSVHYSAQQGFVNHPDHRSAGQAAMDAVYPLARDHMCFPELLADGYEPHNTATLLLIDMQVNESAFAVDISETIEQKYQALAAHASQFSVQKMKEDIDQQAAKTGARHGYRYAESFVRIDVA